MTLTGGSDQSSPEVSWLQTNTTSSTPSKSNPTPAHPSLIKLAQDNQLKQKYDARLHQLQQKLLEKDRELELYRLQIDKTTENAKYESSSITRAHQQTTTTLQTSLEKLQYENKQLNCELAHLKSEMAVLGSEPVSADVIDELKDRPHLSVRQIAEIRVFELVKPLKIELQEKSAQLENMFKKYSQLETVASDHKDVHAGMQRVKNEYHEQLTRQKLELVDSKNKLAQYEHIVKDYKRLQTEHEEQRLTVSQLNHEIEQEKSINATRSTNLIKLEKELAVLKQQTQLLSSDKKFLEREREELKAKTHSISLDLQNQWKELETARLASHRTTETNAQTECKLLEANTRVARLESQLTDLRRQFQEQGVNSREGMIRAQHDTDLTHEKMIHLQNGKKIVEEQLMKMERDLYEARRQLNGNKGVYEKDVKILEEQLLESQRAKDLSEVDRLKAVAQVKENGVDIDALQHQLQILHSRINHQNTLQIAPNTSSFDLSSITIPGIDDLEQELHSHPFGTAVRLARRLYDLHHNPNLVEKTASFTKLKKQLALKTTNENKLKTDVQNLLQLGTQVKQMRGTLKSLASIDQDKERIHRLESEYQRVVEKTPVNVL